MPYPQVISPFLSFTTFSFTGLSNPRLSRPPALKKGGIWCIKGRDLVIAGERFGVWQGGIWCLTGRDLVARYLRPFWG